MAIKDRFLEIRSKLELSQADAASKFDIALGSWKKYEKGPSEPGSGALLGLAKGGININWLLTGIGPMLVTDLGAAAAVQSNPIIEEEQEYACPVDHDRLLQAITEVNAAVKFHHGSNRLTDAEMAVAITMAYEEIEEEERQAVQAAKARSQSILNRLVKQK
jgi:transcriptional regulator with XRE-family HTH domain